MAGSMAGCLGGREVVGRGPKVSMFIKTQLDKGTEAPIAHSAVPVLHKIATLAPAPST